MWFIPSKVDNTPPYCVISSNQEEIQITPDNFLAYTELFELKLILDLHSPLLARVSCFLFDMIFKMQVS